MFLSGGRLSAAVLSAVKRVLSEEGKMVISVSGNEFMKTADIGFLRQYSLWGKSEKQSSCVFNFISSF